MNMRTDVFSETKRSAVMRAVKSSDTAPERAVRGAARAAGYARRYRLGGSGLPGKPDLVFGALGKVVFVHGCFWHGHGCKRGARKPKTNTAYWAAKIARNRARDETSLVSLGSSGWKILVIWECETYDAELLAARLRAFLRHPVARLQTRTKQARAGLKARGPGRT